MTITKRREREMKGGLERIRGEKERGEEGEKRERAKEDTIRTSPNDEAKES